ncbi:hypothetical protein [Streptomyces sp. KL116D]|uniref:hypothetical protein n=1 Tax=Streptomyces sp. KL116D TaxID=3045152 RepID=UPI0035572D30
MRRIIGALGGMAAEQVVYGVITTGAENDLEQVTNIARGMVARWGMSEEGRPSVGPPERCAAGLRSRRRARHPRHDRRRNAPHRGRVLRERACHKLRDHRDQLNALAAALLENETLEEADAYRVAGITRLTKD